MIQVHFNARPSVFEWLCGSKVAYKYDNNADIIDTMLTPGYITTVNHNKKIESANQWLVEHMFNIKKA